MNSVIYYKRQFQLIIIPLVFFFNVAISGSALSLPVWIFVLHTEKNNNNQIAPKTPVADILMFATHLTLRASP